MKFFWHADKHQSFLHVDNIILGVCNQAYPKYPKKKFAYLHYLQKSMGGGGGWGGGGGEVGFLPANEHESFLQVHSIPLGLHSQAYPKYPKQ